METLSLAIGCWTLAGILAKAFHMDSFSSRTFNAIEAVLYIALNPGTEPVRSRDICEYQAVAVRYLEPMLQKLVHAEILRGVRGPKGGYLLARERRKIALSEIIDVVQPGSDEQGAQTISPLRKSITSPMWLEAKHNVMERFAGITIADLCQQANEKGVKIGNAGKGDFTI